MLKRNLGFALAIASLVTLAPLGVGAAVIFPGTPTITVPSSLFDPLCPSNCTLTSPLPAGEFLLPIDIAGANGLQDWSFDLLFNSTVVNPLDVGGFYQSVYQAAFKVADTTLSNITSSGFPSPGSLQGIAGFSSGVSGNGILAYILFQFEQGQERNPPNFRIDNPTIQQVPEPGTFVLLAGGLMLLSMARQARRGPQGAL